MNEEYRIDEYGQHENLRRRSVRNWFRDVWAAMRGKTFCTMRITQGERTWYVDCRQEYVFPLTNRRYGISLDLLAWNSSMFFPMAKRPHPPAYEAEHAKDGGWIMPVARAQDQP
jgi:hypothetical protein